MYHNNTPEGKTLRDSVIKDAEGKEEHGEFRIEDPDSWNAKNKEEGGEDDEEEFGKTVTWDSRIEKTTPTIKRTD